MISLTVKTLDSQNHQFSVEDDITVEQFKQHIADTVKISAETQRIIYCGRVLQDASKLNDYDVNGKVVHLVQRPPPGLNNASQSSNTGNNTTQENRRSHRRLYPAMDSGTMFLGSVAFPTNIIDSQSIVSQPPTHNHVGSRLNVARRMLRRAEHIISLLENPNITQQTPPEDTQEEVTPVIEATVLVPSNGSEPFDEAAIFSAVNNFHSAQSRSAPGTSSNTERQQQSSSTNPQQPSETTGNNLRNSTRTTSMAELLTMLTQLQSRFAPFLQRYQDFMQNDPVIPSEELQSVQNDLNRVSEVFHFLGHAYHSLSDIIIRVQTPPPRPLLCRYIIQHSTVVRTGIPIQVEAQISVSGDRTTGRSTTSTTTTAPTAPRTPTANTANTTTTTSNDAPPSSNLPEVEFVMEVSPEGITLDSMGGDANQAEELLRGAAQNQANQNWRSLNGQPAPPSLIASILQMAGGLYNNQGGEVPTPSTGSRTSQTRGTTPSNQTRGGATSRPRLHLQQQTLQGVFDPFLPCNSHHVRRRSLFSGDIPRDQPQAAAGAETVGDPQQQRRQEAVAAAQDATAQLNSLMSTIVNGIRNAYQVRRQSGTTGTTAGSSSESNSSGNARNVTPHAENAPSAPPAEEAPPQIATFLTGNVSEMLRGGPTLAEIMQQLPPDNSYVPGDSIITDFIMMVSNNLRIGDIIMLNNGNIEPLSRMVSDIQNFFVNTLMNGSRSEGAIESAVERLLNEMQPFFDTLGQIPIRDDIDVEASLRRLLRAKLPSIFRLSCRISDEPNNLRTLVDQFVSTVKELLAVTLRASSDGIRGIDRIFDVVATRYMEGIPAGLQQWTLITGRSHFRQLVTNIDIPTETISSFVVHRNVSETAKKPDEVVIESEETMEIEETPEAVAQPVEIEQPLPNVVIGSEAWHSQVPEDWVPIIARDTQRQKHQQAPFSDAYLSGMPSKRRKLVHASKGRQNLPLSQVIAENVRRAVTATGLTAVAPLETVARAAGASEDIQTAYRGLLRSSVQEGVRNNEDFTPERFPNASEYFGGSRI